MRTCKNCTIIATHRSFSAYKRMHETTKLIDIDLQKKIQCKYEYREEVATKFVPKKPNKEEA